MNKSMGLSTGAVLMLGVLLRTGTGGAPAPAAERPPATPSSTASTASATSAEAIDSTARKLSGEGPWTASCRYWETSTGLSYPASDDQENKVSIEFKGDAGKIESKLATSAGEAKSECERNGDSWGLPAAPAKGKQARVTPNITAIIAAVPDPLHTHLSMMFDRDIDAILQAGAENGFLVSQYWLPWKSPENGPPSPAMVPGASEQAEQRKRELQPGLIVLKYSPDEHDRASYDWRSYDRVIYLFLVGESPASGMNGAQLRNALRYESMLTDPKTAITASLSMRGSGDLAVIGSPNSGSANSLREAIEAANDTLNLKSVHIAGSTETEEANKALHLAFAGSGLPVDYVSFGEDFDYEEHQTLDLLSNSGYATDRVAFLVEDGTVFGDTGRTPPKGYQSENGDYTAKTQKKGPKEGLSPLIIRFPREISLLRNAQASEKASAAPTPYLRLTLKDPAANDTVPHFSAEQTPLSQEAALMSIQRELVAYHAQFLAIQATNMLDEIYLANYFHRACPNIRLVFLGGGDLLLEREVDNVPYIGSVSLTPYNLVGLMRVPTAGPASRAFPDSLSEAMFNAASYTFQDLTVATNQNPRLAGYQESHAPQAPYMSSHASLWATVIGADGYYPLGIAASCAGDSPQSLPDFVAGEMRKCEPQDRYVRCAAHSGPDVAPPSDEMQQFARTAHLFPSMMWTVLSVVLGLYCIGHGAVLLAADFWSPFTRDVAIRTNDQPARRSVYMNIGTVMLFSMVFVLEWPAFSIGPVLKLNHASTNLAIAVFAAGIFAIVTTLAKTWRYSFRLPKYDRWKTFDSYEAACCFFNLAALATLIVIPCVWASICSLDAFGQLYTNYGVFFSVRCLHPDSQVSPVVPVLLVLLAWYLWAFCQTYRLRFSNAARPKLPGRFLSATPLPLYVADSDLGLAEHAQAAADQHLNAAERQLAAEERQLAAKFSHRSPNLYENVTCLLITRELLVRYLPGLKTIVSSALAVVYISLFALLMHFRSIESVDRMVLDPQRRPTSYEALVVALTVPLLVIGLSGWLRMVLVWGSLRRGLLERLEMYPLRAAFNRLKGVGWVAMMRDTDLHTRWRDMSRANESIRQLCNNPDLVAAITAYDPSARVELRATYRQLEQHLKDVYAVVQGTHPPDPAHWPRLHRPGAGHQDLPRKADIADLELIAAIETDYAAISEELLRAVLVPYWNNKRAGFVEGEAQDSSPIHAKRKSDSDDDPSGGPGPVELHAASTCGDPEHVRLAEELLALRYLSLIRAVLGNVRYLMTFVSAAFVLSLVAWNSYPFQPRELVDWAFSLSFLVLGGGIIWVFAQMHRNAILSRVTNTTPNELGLDFYWRIITFGAIPVLTWLSYQFPQAWSGVFRLVQPGLSAMK